MRLLQYRDLDTRRVKAAFAKVRAAIERDDFRSADVKKLAPGNFYRARLDAANRLLLQFARHGEETVCLALEVIEQHAYDKSRFLRGAVVDPAKIELDDEVKAGQPAIRSGAAALRYLHPARNEFDLLDKPLSFDEVQQALYDAPAPLILVGSAGSGKTALTLARLRRERGRLLYVTQSAYLAQSARALYYAHGYDNDAQETDFLSYLELIETLRVPAGREVGFGAFQGWFDRHRQAVRQSLGGVDAHALFEEFRGVIGSAAAGPLDREAYRALGVRQSLLPADARDAAYDLFEKYRAWLQEAQLFDLNLVAHEWRALAQPEYDFMVVDEVQDLTNAQLALLLKLLKEPGAFVLCGDSNQIVHPNFFSWAAVRALFWQGVETAAAGDKAVLAQPLNVLTANFRNTREVTRVANALLKIKHARFGSVDRESNFLVQAASAEDGAVQLLPDKDAVKRDLNQRTRASTQFAVIVLRNEDKAAAKEFFQTPLVFSVLEAKGLEYPNVILVNLISGQRAAFADICEGVEAADLQTETLDFRRARDKSDKSLEIYKFYVNALYVAMTRAVEKLYLVESDTAHPLLQLLDLRSGDERVQAAAQASSREDWAVEARRLELQGKQEQADAIRRSFLKHAQVPWTVWDEPTLRELQAKALDRTQPSNKPRQALFDYALWHAQHRFVERLAEEANFAPARQLVADEDRAALELFRMPATKAPSLTERTQATFRQRLLAPFAARNFKDVLRQCDQYGIDHRTIPDATPLMMAARAGNAALVEALLARGADPLLADPYGHTAWLMALDRATEDAAFASGPFGPLYDLLAPPSIDVQVAGRLVRLDRSQGEYWFFNLMLAGLKTLASRQVRRAERHYKYRQGFFADHLMKNADAMPAHVLKPERRRRIYANQVLARAEVDSSYLPARRLWVRTVNGHYLPNPELQLRVPAAARPVGDEAADSSPGIVWQPVYGVLNLALIDEGTLERPDYPSLTALLEAATGRPVAGGLQPQSAASPAAAAAHPLSDGSVAAPSAVARTARAATGR